MLLLTSFFNIKTVLTKGKQKYVEKKSQLSLNLVKKVGEKKQGVQVQVTLEVS